MTMCIGFITKRDVYLAADARHSGRIPLFGRRRYDYGEKIIYLNENEKLWMTNAGIGDVCDYVYEECQKEKIETIDGIDRIESVLFEEMHEKALKKYNLPLNENKNKSSSYLNLIFAGIDKQGNPKMCFVDSGKDYKLNWFDKPGDFVYNRVFNDDMDAFIRENLERISKQALENDDFDSIVRNLKVFFKQVSEGETSGVISPLKDVLKIIPDGIEVRELRKTRKFIDDIRFRVDRFLFYKILHLHKLSPHHNKNWK